MLVVWLVQCMLAGQVRAGEAEEDLLNLQAFAGARRIPPQAPQELRTTPGAEAEASVQNTSLAEPHLFPANARACGACSTWRPRAGLAGTQQVDALH